MTASAVISYLRQKRTKDCFIKSENFVPVNLGELGKELGIKRYRLRSAIDTLCNVGKIKLKTTKDKIFKNVSFSILRNENEENHGAVFCDNSAATPLKIGAGFCDNSAATPVQFSATTAHKRRAASMYSVINKLITLKENDFVGEDPNLLVVRKNLRKWVNFSTSKKEGTNLKKPALFLAHNASNLAVKPETQAKVSTLITEAEKSTIMAKEILAYLNEKAGKKFRVNAKSNLAHVLARVKEGYNILDFKKVIDVKSAQWKETTFSNGTSGKNYLRPSTLFSPKNFENYLNEESESSLENDLENFFQKSGCIPS